MFRCMSKRRSTPPVSRKRIHSVDTGPESTPVSSPALVKRKSATLEPSQSKSQPQRSRSLVKNIFGPCNWRSTSRKDRSQSNTITPTNQSTPRKSVLDSAFIDETSAADSTTLSSTQPPLCRQDTPSPRKQVSLCLALPKDHYATAMAT
ncbi:hypothetical protein Ciccas_005196 [Cichlidogyrus casuarinus]|uniref:Uncharacterized protein n=1 Tax=Cichlidogyrus casuarinus TaxID=1844966 RepID=A0ABD2Q9E4_9PLAT